jgi:hypothetical protein
MYVTLFSNASQKLCPDNTLGAFTTHLGQPIDLGPTDRWVVGICEFTCPPPTVGTFNPVMIVGENVLIYCSLITPQFVGGNLLRCVRTYISPTLDGQHLFKKVCASRKTMISRHTDRIIDFWGTRIPFKDSKTSVKLVLHFRRIPTV